MYSYFLIILFLVTGSSGFAQTVDETPVIPQNVADALMRWKHLQERAEQARQREAHQHRERGTTQTTTSADDVLDGVLTTYRTAYNEGLSDADRDLIYNFLDGLRQRGTLSRYMSFYSPLLGRWRTEMGQVFAFVSLGVVLGLFFSGIQTVLDPYRGTIIPPAVNSLLGLALFILLYNTLNPKDHRNTGRDLRYAHRFRVALSKMGLTVPQLRAYLSEADAAREALARLEQESRIPLMDSVNTENNQSILEIVVSSLLMTGRATVHQSSTADSWRSSYDGMVLRLMALRLSPILVVLHALKKRATRFVCDAFLTQKLVPQPEEQAPVQAADGQQDPLQAEGFSNPPGADHPEINVRIDASVSTGTAPNSGGADPRGDTHHELEVPRVVEGPGGTAARRSSH